MESTRHLVNTEYQGKSCGFSFDHTPQNLAKAVATRILVTHSSYIRSLMVHYEGQTRAIRRGKTEGTVAEVVLWPGEFITIIEGAFYSNSPLYSIALVMLSFVSNKGRRWGPYGTRYPASTTFTWDVATLVPSDLAPCMGLLCFKGYSGGSNDGIQCLQAIFAKYPSPRQPPEDVNYEQQTRDGLSPKVLVTLSKFARSLMSPIISLYVGTERIEFLVYEDKLCQLPFFQAALKGAFREASDKKITMPEDEPEIVAALIEFLYTSKYTYTYDPDGDVSGRNIPVGGLREGLFHARVYVLASKYDCQPLADVASRNLTYIMDQIGGIDVVRLLKETYDKGWEISMWENREYMTKFKCGLPEMLKDLYVTHHKEMSSMMTECPALANDILRLVVSR